MLGGVKVSASELLALLVATSFAAGLNLYATVATLGLLARGGLLPLPATLQLLASWYGVARALRALFRGAEQELAK